MKQQGRPFPRHAAAPGVVVAGPHSGCGKTTVTLALMAALRRRGLEVAPFKVGPDFIDPGLHAAVCGRPSRNLDGWMSARDEVLGIFARGMERADVAVVEGVMGLFDGARADGEAGSTAEIAKWLGLPVLLVVDAARAARSVAALVRGFRDFDPELRLAGVLLNRVGGSRHAGILLEALAPLDLPWVGWLPRREELRMPSRHLGLVTAAELDLGPGVQAALAGWMEGGGRMEELLRVLGCPEGRGGAARRQGPPGAPARPGGEPRPVVAVAMDRAFCFYYRANLDLLEAAGAELAFFSPLRDTDLPAGTSGLYLGGGYPELHGPALAENRPLLGAVRRAVEAGMPVYAECGGLLYLCRGLLDPAAPGGLVPWVGALPYAVEMTPRRRALGYREVELAVDCLLGPAGTRLRGHEFHYSRLVPAGGEGTPPAARRPFRVWDAAGRLVETAHFHVERTVASYVHLHLAGCPGAAASWVAACRAYAAETVG
ncbi:cobyrinate a,c-diamide synthase [Dissulfurirhabdus thermomarina]|uniref:Cobyrinate a,c-diamide synthase n=1 Tax=Dissulfurirhabdus thermomarina TaxID=1765737 RepID=A0A6N9TMK5_DISTH|nr:cobyrinate a,c-diamide synthase [Dissulfurirhabdus thermomarina]NDY42278.1 cobyrinate a,c-diamide synthase [Dissulfurirhabdus thermomarina]NMX22783.1 cobyrinate a,c-diamide synthase [Dissulfurirhabdus thermomarina]